MWPVAGPDLAAAAVQFMETRLQLPAGRLTEDQVVVKSIYSPPDSVIKSQVLVRFDSVSLRDEVKALGKNLSGRDRSVGIQIEVPDHLRGRFQTFQSLAYKLKSKYPNLRRNVKFNDAELTLVMDVKLSPDQDWKAVLYEDANAILPRGRNRTASISRTELAGLVAPDPGKPGATGNTRNGS